MCKWNRFLAAVLSASMVFTMTPVQGLAADQAVAAQEESAVNEADEENDNSADAGSEQAVDTNAAQGENEGANSDSVTPTESDDAGQQNLISCTQLRGSLFRHGKLYHMLHQITSVSCRVT